MPCTQEKLFASVLIDLRLDKTLDYEVPESMIDKISVGSRVEVSVRKNPCFATVIALKNSCEFANPLFIETLLSEQPVVTPELFTLSEWMARYYSCSLRKALKIVLPGVVRQNLQERKKETLLLKSLLSLDALKEKAISLRKKAPCQAEILDHLLKNPQGIHLNDIACKKVTLKNLVEKGILELIPILSNHEKKADFEYFISAAKTLSNEQQAALDAIMKPILAKTFQPFLLFGITGSGKTEVYLQAMQQVLDAGESVIFLVPEISLASQTLERIKSRFQEKVILLHHKISTSEKTAGWNSIHDGSARIVVGARSAIFAPIRNLGLIIVDEEHEGSYKQTDETPCYHARDVAIMRAKFKNVPIILGSATPSFESYYNAKQGKYSLITLKERAASASLPKVHIIDMAKEFEKAKGFTLFSEALITGIKKRLDVGEQVLLFLNRRGYHSAQNCNLCGHIMKCPHCDISLTYHLGDNVLACHLCDFRQKPPRSCPSCHKEEGLKFKGAGTELVEKSLQAILPGVRTLRLDADTTSKKGAHDTLFRAFKAGKADVLIGTQMIAKGLHFPSLTLAAVLYADAGLTIPDFRASEHSFQILLQVSGRAGRGVLPGEVILQTNSPDSALIRHVSHADYEGFFEDELEHRKMFGYPPFSRLIKIMVYGKDEKKTLSYGNHLRQTLIQILPKTFELQPVTPSGYTKIKGNFRFQFLLRTGNVAIFHRYLEKADELCIRPYGVEKKVDVDPLQTFL